MLYGRDLRSLSVLLMRSRTLRAYLARHGIRLSKRAGQHFMLDDRVLRRMVGYAKLTAAETVLEIGAGCGLLTSVLASHAARVYAIEKDARLVAVLREEMPTNVEVIAGDALEVDLPPADRIVGNIPYQISSPLIFRLLEEPIPGEVRRMVLTVQAEFAQRLVASPGSDHYSRLSVMAGVYARCEICEPVPPSAFYPRPRVDSAIIALEKYASPLIEAEVSFFTDMVRHLFSQRRKMIRTALRNRPLVPMQKGDWRALIDEAPIPFARRRVEELSIDELDRLAAELLARIERLSATGRSDPI